MLAAAAYLGLAVVLAVATTGAYAPRLLGRRLASALSFAATLLTLAIPR